MDIWAIRVAQPQGSTGLDNPSSKVRKRNEFWHSGQTMLAIQRNLNVNYAIPDPGDQRRCEHKSSFQHPKLLHFCQMSYFTKGNISIRKVLRLVWSWKEPDQKSHTPSLSLPRGPLGAWVHKWPSRAPKGGQGCWHHWLAFPSHRAAISLNFWSAWPSY